MACGALVFAALSFPCREACASDSERSGPTYDVKLSVDGPVIGISTVVAGSWLLRNELSPPPCAPLCARDGVFVLDRFAAGAYRPAWARVSDVGVGAIYVGSLVVTLVDEGFADGLTDWVVIGESIMLSHATATAMNFAMRRPRPYVYGTEAPLDTRMSGDAGMSFFSGHTAGSFAAATALAGTIFRRYPHSPWRFVALGAGLLGASLVGISRIAAGHHFPTDVASGAAVGVGYGLLVPTLHDAGLQVAPMEGGLQVMGAF